MSDGSTKAPPPNTATPTPLREADDPWLTWAREVQAIGQTGLAYVQDVFDKERYERLNELAAEMMTALTDGTPPPFARLYAEQKGYATPKLDIRGIAFRDNKLLMVKETTDGKWSVPGGFADVGYSPAEIVVKEMREEAGFEVKATRLLAVYDRAKHNHTPWTFHMYKLFFACEITGGEARGGSETTEVGFFDLDDLPELSLGRITEAQIRRMHELYHDAEAEAEFD